MGIRIMGDQLYELIKPHVDAKFYGEYYEDEKSLVKLSNMDDLSNEIIISLNELYLQTYNRNESSAIELRKRLMPILRNIKNYAEEWEV